MWDIGLRPIIKELIFMTNNISLNKKITVKKMFLKKWFNLFGIFLKEYSPEKSTTVEWIVSLKKK